MSKAAPAPDNTVGSPQSSGLLETKLYARAARANLVARPRIGTLLDNGLAASLILVSAPAGFGKTTVLAEWLAGKGKSSSPQGPLRGMRDRTSPSENLYPLRSAWLSLDAADNDPTRFWAYVILSMQSIRDELGETVLAQLRSPQPPPVQQLLPSLLNEMDAFQDRGILVLDDYHVITSTAVHGSVSYLLENLPSDFHVVISTRSDPPIPLAKLRARGQVTEIRTDELRFMPDEAAAFLNQTMGLALSPAQVTALGERTEGWVAGLQMAALSMRGREDVDGFIRAFTGTHRFIMDYLLEEVLAREPEEVQTFLLRTAILTRLTGPLCDAVTGNCSETSDTVHGQEMLERLERRNLFIVPLDDERRWYRYHHLFADLLRTQMQKSLGQQEIAALHFRALEWYEQNGLTLEAIYHASLASDYERIERLIEQNYTEMLNRGEMASIRFWMGKLSKDLVHRRPWLSLYEAFSRSWFGQLEEASLLLADAEARIRSDMAAPGARAMLGYHAYVQSRVTAMQGDTRRAIELCLAARENTPADKLGIQIEIGTTLGYEYFLAGDFVNAARTLQETIVSCHAVDAVNNPVAAIALLARMQIIQGRLHDARDLMEKAAQLVHETGGEHRGAIGLVDVEIAALLCEWNDIAAALARVKHGLDCLPLWGKADDLALAQITLSRIQLARGDQADAARAIEKATRLTSHAGVFCEARNAVESAQVRLWLAQGDGPALDRWAAATAKRFGSPDPFRFEDESIHIALARVLIARNQPDKAIRLLSSLEECARSSGRRGRLIEIMVLTALAMQAAGDTRQANIALTTSLEAAQPEGYIRIFVDEGPPMEQLLTRRAAHDGSDSLREYGLRLLSQLRGTPQVIVPPQDKGSQSDAFVEPLTHRELQVLKLICAGDSNQVIADKLVITVGAVKKHTGNILGKLGVASRSQAIVKAHELGLFPGAK